MGQSLKLFHSKFRIFFGTFSFLHSGWLTARIALSEAALKKGSLFLAFMSFDDITSPS